MGRARIQRGFHTEHPGHMDLVFLQLAQFALSCFYVRICIFRVIQSSSS